MYIYCKSRPHFHQEKKLKSNLIWNNHNLQTQFKLEKLQPPKPKLKFKKKGKKKKNHNQRLRLICELCLCHCDALY